ASGSRSRRGSWRSPAYPLQFGAAAAVRTADQEPRCAAANSLPARSVDRRLPGGVGSLVGQRCAGVVGINNLAPEGDVERRARSLAQARPVDPALRLRLGGWHLPAGPAGLGEAVHSRADGLDPGGTEGAG